MVREEGVSSLGRGVTPNVFRAILMNASQLASYVLILNLFLQLFWNLEPRSLRPWNLNPT